MASRFLYLSETVVPLRIDNPDGYAVEVQPYFPPEKINGAIQNKMIPFENLFATVIDPTLLVNRLDTLTAVTNALLELDIDATDALTLLGAIATLKNKIGDEPAITSAQLAAVKAIADKNKADIPPIKTLGEQNQADIAPIKAMAEKNQADIVPIKVLGEENKADLTLVETLAAKTASDLIPVKTLAENNQGAIASLTPQLTQAKADILANTAAIGESKSILDGALLRLALIEAKLQSWDYTYIEGDMKVAPYAKLMAKEIGDLTLWDNPKNGQWFTVQDSAERLSITKNKIIAAVGATIGKPQLTDATNEFPLNPEGSSWSGDDSLIFVYSAADNNWLVGASGRMDAPIPEVTQAELDAVIADLQAEALKIAANKAKADANEALNLEQDGAIALHKTQIGHHSTDIAGIGVILTDHNGRITKNTDDTALNTQQNVHHQNDIGNLAGILQTNVGRLNAHQAKLNDLPEVSQAELDAVITVNNEQATELQQANVNRAALRQDLDDLGVSVTDTRQWAQRLQTQVEEIPPAPVTEGEETIINTRLTDLEARPIGTGGDITNIQNTVNNFGDRLTTLENTIQNFITNVGDRLSALENAPAPAVTQSEEDEINRKLDELNQGNEPFDIGIWPLPGLATVTETGQGQWNINTPSSTNVYYRLPDQIGKDTISVRIKALSPIARMQLQFVSGGQEIIPQALFEWDGVSWTGPSALSGEFVRDEDEFVWTVGPINIPDGNAASANASGLRLIGFVGEITIEDIKFINA